VLHRPSVLRLHKSAPLGCIIRFMSELKTPKVVSVVLTDDLAARSLDAANARDLSRSAWIRSLIESALNRTETN
jgi:hypothetical protein